MSTTLRKANGDLFIDSAGRAQLATGPTKVSQELFDLYATPYDAARNWGTDLNLTSYGLSGSAQIRALLFSRVSQANSRMLAKQRADAYLDPNSEAIQSFPVVEVMVQQGGLFALFYSVANVGNPALTVQQVLALNYMPYSSGNVLPFSLPTGVSLLAGGIG